MRKGGWERDCPPSSGNLLNLPISVYLSHGANVSCMHEDSERLVVSSGPSTLSAGTLALDGSPKCWYAVWQVSEHLTHSNYWMWRGSVSSLCISRRCLFPRSCSFYDRQMVAWHWQGKLKWSDRKYSNASLPQILASNGPVSDNCLIHSEFFSTYIEAPPWSLFLDDKARHSSVKMTRQYISILLLQVWIVLCCFILNIGWGCSIIGCWGEEVTGEWKYYISGTLRCVLPTKYRSGDQMKSNEISGTCSTYGGQERFMQDFGGETWWKETTLKTQA